MTQTTPKASAQRRRAVFGKFPPLRVGTATSRHGCCRCARPAWRALPNSAFPRCTTRTGASRTSRRSPNCRSSRCGIGGRCRGSKATLEKFIFAHLPGSRLVFVNGFFNAALSAVASCRRRESRQPRRRADHGFRAHRKTSRPIRADGRQFLCRAEPGVLPRRRLHPRSGRPDRRGTDAAHFHFDGEAQRRHDSAAQPHHRRGQQQGDGHRKLLSRGQGRVFHQRRHGNCRRRQRGAGTREISGRGARRVSSGDALPANLAAPAT